MSQERAVAEALACGVPVLISREVNIWREIEAARAGLVAADTIEGTSSLLTRWQQLPEEERSVMRGAAGRCFQAHFDIEHSAKRLLDVVEETTAEDKSR